MDEEQPGLPGEGGHMGGEVIAVIEVPWIVMRAGSRRDLAWLAVQIHRAREGKWTYMDELVDGGFVYTIREMLTHSEDYLLVKL